MLCLLGMSATSGIMTLSKHEREAQKKIMKRNVNGSLKLRNFLHQGK